MIVVQMRKKSLVRGRARARTLHFRTRAKPYQLSKFANQAPTTQHQALAPPRLRRSCASSKISQAVHRRLREFLSALHKLGLHNRRRFWAHTPTSTSRPRQLRPHLNLLDEPPTCRPLQAPQLWLRSLKQYHRRARPLRTGAPAKRVRLSGTGRLAMWTSKRGFIDQGRTMKST